jgi:hypothetical protein
MGTVLPRYPANLLNPLTLGRKEFEMYEMALVRTLARQGNEVEAQGRSVRPSTPPLGPQVLP